ncbi:hypothetical protein KM043_015470 [Ampulex compressa]|nr:hypothetical protein KM043_015470 [Ampulex compressa]
MGKIERARLEGDKENRQCASRRKGNAIRSEEGKYPAIYQYLLDPWYWLEVLDRKNGVPALAVARVGTKGLEKIGVKKGKNRARGRSELRRKGGEKHQDRRGVLEVGEMRGRTEGG